MEAARTHARPQDMAQSDEDEMNLDIARIAEMARTMNKSAIAKEFGVSQTTIDRIMAKHGIVSGWKRSDAAYDNLAELAKTMTVNQIAAEIGKSPDCIRRAMHSRGLRAVPDLMIGASRYAKSYDDIAEHCGNETVKELCVRYDASEKSIRQQLAKYGLKAKPAVRVYETPKNAFKPYRPRWENAPHALSRSKGQADLAQEFLQRECAVFRCDRDGRAKADGQYYRRGSRVMEPAELMAMAQRKGWKPDAWRMV